MIVIERNYFFAIKKLWQFSFVIRRKNLKKPILIIMIITLLILFTGCGKDKLPQQNGQNGNNDLQTLISSLKNEDGTKTMFDIKISGGYEKQFGYVIERTNGKITATVYDGESKTYTDVSLTEAIADYENNLLSANGQGVFQGNLKDVVFLAPADLFNLDNTTVRSVDRTKNNDGTTTYTPSLYESKVKTALPCFKNVFSTVSDVVNLHFKTDKLGTKTEITVQMQAKDQNATQNIDVLLTVTHTKTIKVIY